MSQKEAPRRLLPESVVIRNMITAERNEAVMTPPRRSVVLSICPSPTAKKIDGGDGEGRAEKRANRGDESRDFGRKSEWISTMKATMEPTAAHRKCREHRDPQEDCAGAPGS